MKNLKSILFSLLAIIAVAVFMTSCEREEVIGQVTDDTFLIDFPEANNDVLKFRDVEHFETVYKKLDKLYDEDDQKFNEVMEDLNKNSVYNKLSNDVFTNPKDRYQPFLTDPVMMSLVNETFEFQVSEVLHTYVTNEVILTSDIDDTETRDKIRNITKGEIMSDKIPVKAYPINDDNFASLLGPWGSKDYDSSKIVFNPTDKSGGCRITGETSWGWTENGTQALSYRAAMYKSWGRTYEEAKVYFYFRENSEWSNISAYRKLAASISAIRTNSECSSDNPESEFNSKCLEAPCSNVRARVNRYGNRYHRSGEVTGGYYYFDDWGSFSATNSIYF